MVRRSIFFDLVDSTEAVLDSSKWNHDEAYLTKKLMETIVSLGAGNYGLQQFAGKIGVITPYTA